MTDFQKILIAPLFSKEETTYLALCSVACFPAWYSYVVQFALWEVLEKGLIWRQLTRRWQMPSTHFLGISTNFLLKSDSKHPQCGFHTAANISKSFEESKQRPNQLKMFWLFVFLFWFCLSYVGLAPSSSLLSSTYVHPSTPSLPLSESLALWELPVQTRVHNNNLLRTMQLETHSTRWSHVQERGFSLPFSQ